MSVDTQDDSVWKQKYYDQLDNVERKEKDWKSLESMLKRAIGRLSLATEGRNKSLDRHVNELRNVIKNDIKIQRLESVVDDITNVLTQLQDEDLNSKRFAVNLLEQLVQSIELPVSCEKQSKKLTKQLAKADDNSRDTLLKDTVNLLKSAIPVDAETNKENSKFLGRLFKGKQADISNDNEAVANTATSDVQSIASILDSALSQLPWPNSIQQQSVDVIKAIKLSDSINGLQENIKQVEELVKFWAVPELDEFSAEDSKHHLKSYKSCLINLLNNVDKTETTNDELSAFKKSVNNAKEKNELVDLSAQLSEIFLSQAKNTKQLPTLPDISTMSDDRLQPSIQELFIRLLEQLIVPADMQKDVNKMKLRLEKEAKSSDWKNLLKDVVVLINSIRSRLHKEKYEFESFLQQITDRLKTMDQFFQTENDTLHNAQSTGATFDETITRRLSENRKYNH